MISCNNSNTSSPVWQEQPSDLQGKVNDDTVISLLGAVLKGAKMSDILFFYKYIITCGLNDQDICEKYFLKPLANPAEI